MLKLNDDVARWNFYDLTSNAIQWTMEWQRFFDTDRKVKTRKKYV